MSNSIPGATIEQTARKAAARVAADAGPGVMVEVEAALGAENSSTEQYFDPISLGALIVSAAGLGWTIVSDLRRKGENPTRTELVHRIRLELGDSPSGHEQVIDIVAEEILDDGTENS